MTPHPTPPASVWSPRETLLAVGAVTLVWAVGVAVWPLLGEVVPWDSKNQFHPFLKFLGQAHRAGEWPLWNPYQYAGYPAVADPQSLFFDPVFHLLAVLVPNVTLEVFDVAVMLHVLVGALAIVGLARHEGWHPVGAVFGAVVLLFGGSVMARLNHTGLVVSTGLLPLAIWWLVVAIDRRSLLASLGFTLAAVAMVIGRNQVAILGAASLVALAVHRTAVLPDWRERLTRLPLFALMAVLGGALIAVPFLLTTQFLALSNRPAFDYAFAATGSLHPTALATFLAPDVFLSFDPEAYFGPAAKTRPWVDTTDRTINYVFFGTATALVVLWHGIAGGRALRPGARVWTVALVLALAYALGRFGGLWTLLFDWAPGVALYRRPADATFLVGVFLAVLAAKLMSDYVREGLPRITVVGTGLALVALVAPLAGAIDFAGITANTGVAARAAALSLVVVGATAAPFLMTRTIRQRVTVGAAMVLLVGGELILRHAASDMNGAPRADYAVLDSPSGPFGVGLARLEAEIADRRARGEYPRVEILGMGGPSQNLAMVRGIEAINGYNPLRLVELEVMTEPGQNSHEARLRAFPRGFPGFGSDLARLLGLDYLVAPVPAASLPQGAPQPLGRLLFQAPGVTIEAFGQGVPRARVATAVTRIDRATLLEDRQWPGPLDPNRVLIDEDARLVGDPAAVPPPPGERRAVIREKSLNRLVVEVETNVPGLLVVTDPYYPGWEARRDGVAVPILRADLLFRAVEVPAGRSTVTFEYRPFSVANLRAALRTALAGMPPPVELDSAMKPPKGFPPLYD